MRIAVGMHVAFGMIGGFRHFHRHDALRTIHITRFPILDARIFARFEQRGQKGVFAIEADEHDQIGAIQHRNEAWLHRNAVRVFDAGGKAVNLNMIAADIAR